jgi:acetolactate synthase I/II/III large subunit
MKVSDYVISRLEEYTKDIFLVSGGGCIHLVDSLSKSKINLIPTLHEQGASIAAESYAQYTNKLGVALVTTGPGSTNAVTGVASAWLDSIPVLLLTGQVQNKDRVGNKGVRQLGFQEIDTVSIYKPITKYAVTISDPKTIKYHLNKAIYLATTGRPGPVVIDIPLDVQAAEINPDELIDFILTDKIYDLNSLDLIVEALNKAKRPIVLVGNGVRLANALPEFYEFIKKTGIPVLTTWKTLDILEESHPQYVGRPGGVGQRGANFNQQNSDFILVIGARLDHGQLAYQPQYFAREATKCIVDIDINEINKLGINIEFPIESDAKLFLTQLNQKVNSLNISDWLSYCKSLHIKYPVILPEHLKINELHINNYAFIEYLSDLLPKNSLVIPGSSGACSEVTMQSFKTKIGTRVYNSEGLGSMGFGIPAAIGGCIASDKKETICIDGDGGFFMNIQELELVYRYQLPIKFFVLNNNGYGSIKTTQNTHFKGNLVVSDPSSGLTLPSIELNAAAYKIPYVKIETQQNLKLDLSNVLSTHGPIICELIVDPDHKTLPKASVYKKEDGSFATRPMEDLAPFLDRNEFLNNLLIKPINQ